MHLTTRNVNTGFRTLVGLFNGTTILPASVYPPGIVRRPYSNPNGSGYTLTIDEPVTITYERPLERCLFNSARDANPFSLLYESLYMLAGRNDVAPLAYYTKQFTQYSDDGETLNGAYGYRWRERGGFKWGDERLSDEDAARGYTPFREPEWMEVDQLDAIVKHLKAKPESRRAVLNMWNVEDDLLKIDSSRDVCCNLEVMFSIREHRRSAQGVGVPDAFDRYLDITVTNRSNDLIWGTLGANYVTFSVLQEYMAARLGVEVGRYHQFSNNLHIYDWNWKPDEWLADKEPNWYKDVEFAGLYPNTVPLVRDPEAFERELPLFAETFSGDNPNRSTYADYTEPFLRDVAQPMMCAFYLYKTKQPRAAAGWASEIKADDWRIMAESWLQRRTK